MYADYALEKFFESAAREPWFDNTLFVLTADHTPGTNDPLYSTDLGKVHIPMLFYYPQDSLCIEINRVAGQIDVMPTILQLLGYDKKFFAFGHSLFGQQEGYTSTLIADKYLFFGESENKPWMITFQDESVKQLYQINNTLQGENLLSKHPEISKKLEKQLKAMIQAYNHALLTNSMTVE